MILLEALLLSTLAFGETAADGNASPMVIPKTPQELGAAVEKLVENKAPEKKEEKKPEKPLRVKVKSTYWTESGLCYKTDGKGQPELVKDLEKILAGAFKDDSGQPGCAFSKNEDEAEKEKDLMIQAYGANRTLELCETKNLQQAPLRTPCRTSKNTIFKKTGFKDGTGWLDTKNNLIWLLPKPDTIPGRFTQEEAEVYCAKLGGVLPTKAQFENAEKAGFRDLVRLTETPANSPLVYLRSSTGENDNRYYFYAIEIKKEKDSSKAAEVDKQTPHKKPSPKREYETEKTGSVQAVRGLDDKQTYVFPPLKGLSNPHDTVVISAACVRTP